MQAERIASAPYVCSPCACTLRSQGVFSPVPIARLDEATAKENDALRKEVRFTELAQHGAVVCWPGRLQRDRDSATHLTS